MILPEDNKQRLEQEQQAREVPRRFGPSSAQVAGPATETSPLLPHEADPELGVPPPYSELEPKRSNRRRGFLRAGVAVLLSAALVGLVWRASRSQPPREPSRPGPEPGGPPPGSPSDTPRPYPRPDQPEDWHHERLQCATWSAWRHFPIDPHQPKQPSGDYKSQNYTFLVPTHTEEVWGHITGPAALAQVFMGTYDAEDDATWQEDKRQSHGDDVRKGGYAKIVVEPLVLLEEERLGEMTLDISSVCLERRNGTDEQGVNILTGYLDESEPKPKHNPLQFRIHVSLPVNAGRPVRRFAWDGAVSDITGDIGRSTRDLVLVTGVGNIDVNATVRTVVAKTTGQISGSLAVSDEVHIRNPV